MKILEFSLGGGTSKTIDMPKGAIILSCKLIQGVIFRLWAICDPKATIVGRKFHIVYTGDDYLDTPQTKYIATIKMNYDTQVFHIFDMGEV